MNKLLVLFIIFVGFVGGGVFGREPVSKDLGGARIVERLGNDVPWDASFLDASGETVTLGSYLGADKPVILNLVYFNCPNLCNLVLTGFLEGVKGLGKVPGDGYEIVSLSIDPSDTVKAAGEYKERYLGQLGVVGADKGWHFLTGSKEDIARVAEAVGFGFYFNPKTKQFAHSAGIMILTPEGKVSRYLYGIEYKPFNLKMGILEASQRAIISTVDRVLLFCYSYSPKSEKYVLYALNIMKLACGLVLLSLVGLFVWLWWSKRRSVGDTNE